MTRRTFDLAWLLSPVEESVFRAEHWERRPLLVRREDRRYFDGLLSFDDVDHLLGAGWLAKSRIRLLRDGDELKAETFHHSFRDGEAVANPDKIASHYLSGGTIAVNQLHLSWPPLAELCAKLEAIFSQRVQTNIYFTPPEGQGFNAHFDTHDVFVLQVAGRKTWRVYDRPPVELPLVEQSWKRTDGPTPPHETLLFETELCTGDLLYLPRGYVHEAHTSSELSLHLTVGVIALTYADLAKKAIDLLARRDVRFRRTPPIGFLNGGEALEGAAAALAELAPEIGKPETVGAVVARLEESDEGRVRLILGPRLGQAERAERLGADDWVERRLGVPLYSRLEDDVLRLRFGGKTVDLPDLAEDLVEFVRKTPRFRISDIPPFLGPAGNLSVVRSLVREGLLVTSPEP